MITFAAISSYLMDGVCFCVFNSAYGLDLDWSIQFSTKFSRSFWIDGKVCPDSKICHLYATIPETGSSDIFLNIMVGSDLSGIKVIYFYGG